MNSSIKNLATVALLTAVGLAASACTDDGIDDLGTTDVIAKGGTGGGGGGGGGGGTPAPGDIRTTSAAMTCDDGTVLSITLSKGFQSRVELQMVVASAVAAPATGYLEVSLTDATSGAFVTRTDCGLVTISCSALQSSV